MKKADMLVYRERLNVLRARLMGDVTAMANAALGKGRMDGETSSMPIHMAELGSDNFEQEFTLSLAQTEGDTVSLIDQALQRVAAGEYGKCVECSGVIPKLRLNAIPYTPVCVKCAEALEGA
ncbi:TraR/DksA family transcriptional regulator [Pirellulimonas nuda]|nr:TraR/DksA C4-type zinc finger protein [Pirellulimonas nuda]